MKSNDEQFVQKIRREATRTRQARPLTVWQGLTQIGAIGWTVVVPAVAGAWLGRWLDRRMQSTPAWALALLIIGIAVGCVGAFRRTKNEGERRS